MSRFGFFTKKNDEVVLKKTIPPEPTDDVRPDRSPLSLAFLGDAVYSVLARERITELAEKPENMHSLSVEMVRASAQSEAADRLLPYLSDAERDIYRRGKGADPKHCPSGVDRLTYSKATGLETLFGWLYVRGRMDRAKELFDYCLKSR